jgi:hypothetical protein
MKCSQSKHFSLLHGVFSFRALYLKIPGMQNDKHKTKKDKPERLGPEAPELKHYLIVLGSVALLIILAWICWFKFRWFH